MKIYVRTVKEKKETEIDPITKEKHEYIVQYENGHVDELEINLAEVNALSLDKGVRLIGINKDRYYLTLKSWKEVKKELLKSGLMNRLDLSKVA